MVENSRSDSLAISKEAFKNFQKLMFEQAGIHLSDAKQVLVASRLAKRLRALDIPDYASYFRYIDKGDGGENGELQHCINLLTTNETYFFRENLHLQFLQDEITPKHNKFQMFDVWSAASSTGEEAFSIAMVLAEKLGINGNWRIWATDIATDVLEKARKGIYPEQRTKNVPQYMRKKYLLRGTGKQTGYSAVVPELRRKVTFDIYNLVSSNRPKQKFDVIFCRNVLIYFDKPTKQKVVHRLCSNLKDKGYLISGRSESLHGMDTGLLALKPSIYQMKNVIG